MTGDVIKSFLVGLGFGVDDSSLAKFNKAITSATLKVTALYASTKVAAAGIVYGISKVSEGFEQMGYEYRLIAPAINKALYLRRELLKAYSAAGINIREVIQNSIRLNMSLTKTKFAFEAIYKSVASRFFVLLTRQSDEFRKRLYANMPKIQDALERMIKFVFKAFEATQELGFRLWQVLSRLYDFFAKLHQVTNGWSTAVLALIALWKILNLSFLATPLGMLLTGLLAILALWDDFQVWRDGGKSLFNWGPALPYIEAVQGALSSLLETFKALYNGDYDKFWDNILAFFLKIDPLIHGLAEGIRRVTVAIIEGLIGALSALGSKLLSVAEGLGGTLLTKLFDALGGADVKANLYAAPVANSPLLPSSVNTSSQTNQHVSQQTNINVLGSADANAVGKAVSSEQSRVNFDMVRNLKGATR